MRRTMCRPLSGRGRVECPSPTCLRLSDLGLRLLNRSGLGCFSPRTYGPAASKQLHMTWAIVEGWRSIATTINPSYAVSVTLSRKCANRG